MPESTNEPAFIYAIFPDVRPNQENYMSQTNPGCRRKST